MFYRDSHFLRSTGETVLKLAFALIVIGFVLILGHIGAAQRVVDATRGQDDSLKSPETWLNIYDRQKRRKLQEIAEQAPDEGLRKHARYVLRLELFGVVCFITGMIMLVWVAQFDKRN